MQIYNATGTPITKGNSGIATVDKESEFRSEERTIDNQTTVGDLIQNTSTHYDKGDGTNYVPIANSEYYDITEEGDWWNPTIKTLYDPCPNGYRIPKVGTYGNTSDWTLSEWEPSNLKGGQTFKSSFFATSGYRDFTYGTFTAVGTSGYAWMSTPYSIYSGYLLIFRGNKELFCDEIRGRSLSFPIRCIKD